MAETDLGKEAIRERADYIVERIDDPDRVRSLLRPRVEYTAYALAQLEPGLVERARWYLARGETGTGIAVHSSGGLGHALLVAGDPPAVGAILSLHPGAARTYATFQPQHSEAMRRTYSLATSSPMMRMAITASGFRAVSGKTITLTGADIRRINALYATEGGPAYYAPAHIDGGLYRGIEIGGRLVAIAGTHVISRQERVAVVGNVFTHPAYRGRGLAALVTSAVTERLLEWCDHVVLTVDPNNTPAIRAYKRLGYREACRLIESSARRRDITGLGALLRRATGRLRGRRHGAALVSYRR